MNAVSSHPAITALLDWQPADVITGRASWAMGLVSRMVNRHRLIRLLGEMGDPENAL